MASTGFDTRELQRLATDLDRSSARFKQQSRAVMVRGLLNIKKQMQAEARGVQRGRVSRAISYEVKGGIGGSIVGEVGPEEGGAGSLAFFYYGNSHIGPRIAEPMGAAEAEVPAIISNLVRIASRL